MKPMTASIRKTLSIAGCATEPVLPPIPSVPPPRPVDSVPMGDVKTFPEMKLDIPVASGPFEPTWESIEKNYPGEPAWLRDAKLGIWVHLDNFDCWDSSCQPWNSVRVTPSEAVQPLPRITNQPLASGCRVLRITHDKGWINDLTISDTPGDVWSCSFTGRRITVIAPKEAGAGKIEIQIDGETRATADLSMTGARQARQVVYEINSLAPGKHAIHIVNRGPGPVAADAIVVRQVTQEAE